jgi:flagellar biosynthetic protein FliR
MLLKAIMESYQWIPLSNTLFAKLYSGQISEFILRTFSVVFSLSLQMASPLVVAFFLTDVGLGFLTRVAPQFNIFVIGMPLKVILGFIMLIVLFPGMTYIFQDLFSSMFEYMQKFLNINLNDPVGTRP